MAVNGIQLEPATVPSFGCKPISGNYPSTIQKYTSHRWRLCYLLTAVFTLSMIIRNCMSFAIVCMTGEITSTKGNNSNETNSSTRNSTDSVTTYTGEFAYSSETQGVLISSPSYLSILSPMFGGLLSRKCGAKLFIFFVLATCGVIMLLSPLAARTHLYLIIACRIIVGFAANTIVPASFELWLFWAPVKEKEQLVGFPFTGFSVAQVLQYTLSGFICLIPVDNGWPFIFYVFGTMSIVLSGLWHFIVSERPEFHPGITEAEKAYIISNRTTHVNENKRMPWKNMVRCKAVWAYLVVFFCHDWTNAITFGYLPLYMATVLKFDVSQNGLLSSLPYISRGIATVFWGFLSVRLIGILSVTATRKVMQSAGFLVAAALAISLCYLQEGQEYIAVVIFIISTPFQAVTVNASIITPVDMAPQYSSAITSAGVAFSCLGMMISPLVVSCIIPERSRQQWSVVFYTNAAIYIFASLVFLFFGSGELKPWAVETETAQIPVETTVQIPVETETAQIPVETETAQIPVETETAQIPVNGKENVAYEADIDSTGL